MAQFFAPDNVRELDEGNMSVGQLQTKEGKSQIKRKERIKMNVGSEKQM